MYIFKATENTPQKLVLKDAGWLERLAHIALFLLMVFAMFWIVGDDEFKANMLPISLSILLFLGLSFTLMDHRTQITFDASTQTVTRRSSNFWFYGKTRYTELANISRAITQYEYDFEESADTYRPALELVDRREPFKLTPAYEEDKQAVDETVGLINVWLENYRKSWSG